jgi:hypothetical protein
MWRKYHLPPGEIVLPKPEDILSIGHALKKLRQVSIAVMMK